MRGLCLSILAVELAACCYSDESALRADTGIIDGHSLLILQTRCQRTQKKPMCLRLVGSYYTVTTTACDRDGVCVCVLQSFSGYAYDQLEHLLTIMVCVCVLASELS